MARAVAWVAAAASIALAVVAAIVGAVDTQRTCVGLDDLCDGPHIADGVIAFGLAAALFAMAAALVVWLRRHDAARPDRP